VQKNDRRAVSWSDICIANAEQVSVNLLQRAE
jgi:hypothetical protein